MKDTTSKRPFRLVIGLLFGLCLLCCILTWPLPAAARLHLAGQSSHTTASVSQTVTSTGNPQPPAQLLTCKTSEPPTDSPWLPVAHKDAVENGLDPLVFDWQIWQESGFNPDVHPSPAGAIGIAQFMPATAQGLGIDPTDPAAALAAAAQLDAGHKQQNQDRAHQLFLSYGGGEEHYVYALLLAAYNAGPGAVANAWYLAYVAAGAAPQGPWDWLTYLGGETQRYIPAILGCE